MGAINGTVIGSILAVIFGGGTVKGILDFLVARRTQKIDYTDQVRRTLAEFNEQLASDVKELREEIDSEREKRRAVEEQLADERRERARLERELADERRKRGELEARILRLERDRDDAERSDGSGTGGL